MIIELPNYVDTALIDEIKSSVSSFIPKEHKHAYYRDGKSVYISHTPELQTLDDKLQNFFNSLGNNVIRPRYTPQYKSGDTGYEYHMYEPGQICHTHSDGEVASGNNPNNKAMSCLRYASVVVHLNTPKNGGEIVFPAQNKKIKTETGKVVIFPPYGMYQHYTTPSDDPREVLVTWFIYSNVSVYVEGA